MTTLTYSPSSPSIVSYRPTSPLSRPCSPSPLSGNPISLSRPTSPFPVHSHSRQTHNNKSKSVSCVPTQSIHRLMDTAYTQYNVNQCQAGPSNYSENTITRSSSFKHYSNSSKSSSLYDQPSTLSRSSSVRSVRSNTTSNSNSKRSKAVSPSRLPSTNCVSYFPPFEDMGSSHETSSISSCSSFSAHMEQPSSLSTTSTHIRSRERISSSESPERPNDRIRKYHHVKGRSLGSIATNIMSASLSWSLSSISSCTSPLASEAEIVTEQQNENSQGDHKVVEALTKRFSNSSNGKRRTLESFTITPMDNTCTQEQKQQNQIDDTTSAVVRRREEKLHKRRMKSEFEIETILCRSNSLNSNLGSGSNSMQGRRRNEMKRSVDEDIVENLLIETPLRPQTSTRRVRPNLRLPIPSLPNWRFPLGPSPPVTCLSPDIPLEAFSTAIDNPCLVTLTPSQSSSLISLEVDAIDVGLSVSPSPSPTSPYSFQNGPSTPPKDLNGLNQEDSVSIQRLTPSSCWSSENDQNSYHPEMGMDLKRIGSRTSEMSCETIKQRNQDWLDVTPKPSKIIKRSEGCLDVI